MEDYEYRVINSHATQSQNSSELTGNISKNTSNFTSETDQIRSVGGAMGGGLPLYKSLLPDRMRREARAVGVCGETRGDFLAGRRGWVCGDPVRPVETHGDLGGK